MVEAGSGGDVYDVFISHAQEDAGHARQLAGDLEVFGYHCFVASDDLNALIGTRRWSETLDALLASIPVMVMLVTARSLRSQWVQYEWRSLHDAVLGEIRAGLVVPVLLDRRETASLPSALRYWQVVNLVELGRRGGVVKIVELLDGFRSAAAISERPLDHLLTWSSGAAARPGAGSGPLRTHFATPSSHWRRRLGASAAAIAIVAVALAWRHGLPAWPSRAASASAPTTARGGAKETRPPEPRAGWRAIEAFVVAPSAEEDDFLTRVETWNEAARAFAEDCRAGCSPRQQAAALFCSGKQAWLIGDRARAQRDFERAITVDPSWGVALLGLARAHRDPERRIELARQAYAKDPTLWSALGLEARLLMEEFDFGSAVEELMEERRVAPEAVGPRIDAQLARAYALLAQAHHADGFGDEKAARLAQLGCSGGKPLAAACTVLAERALEHHDADEALRYVEQADRDDYLPLVLARGDALQMKGDLEHAWMAWRRVVAFGAGRARGTAEERVAAITDAVRTNLPPPPRARTSSRVERANRPSLD